MKSHDVFPFLENPLATVDQRDLEERALRLVKRPEFERARAVAAHRWRNAVAYPARDQMSQFDSMIDEYVFHHALWAANSDPCHPKDRSCPRASSPLVRSGRARLSLGWREP